MKTRLLQKENSIWAFFYTVALWAVSAVRFDFYYELNDDMLMKDVISGIYTGTPSGYNMQMHYPLSFFLSLFYRITGKLPWYGLFFLLVQFGCIYLFTERLLTFFTKRRTKFLALILETGMVLLLCFKELVFIQYSFSCALLCATAIFRMVTGKKTESAKAFWKQNAGNVALLLLAYIVRSEMMLLMLPCVCVAGVCKWAEEKPIFTKKNAVKYFSLFGMILGGILLLEGVHRIAYGSNDWKEFTRFFDARTEFYDFHKIPPYYGNEAFYQSIGLDEDDWHLLIEWYDFGMEESIDADVMEKIAKYAADCDKAQNSFRERIKQAFIDYRYRTFYQTDYPHNMLCLALFCMVLIAAFANARYRYLWELGFLAGIRSVVWLYMQYRGRMPARITHSLYLAEFILLLALFLTEYKEIQKEKNKVFSGTLGLCFAGIFAMLFIWHGGRSYEACTEEYDYRETVNREYRTLLSYVKENPENFYFIDVFSTVKYSTKLFEDKDHSLLNMDLMGGWLIKSPATKEKWENYGITSMQDGLLENPHVRLVVKSEEEYEMRFICWVEHFYEKRGIPVKAVKEQEIETGSDLSFAVYVLTE